MFDPNDVLLVLGEQTMKLRLAEQELREAQVHCRNLADRVLELEEAQGSSPAKTTTKRRRRAS